MIFLTGDLHADKSRFKRKKCFHPKKGDVLVICGDFGFVWDGSKSEQKLARWVGRRRYRVLFVDGCNENHKLLAEYPITQLYDGKVRNIYKNLNCLMRGEIYNIDEKRLFAFGGGDSAEQFSKKKGDPYLLPSADEMQNASENLSKCGDKVDLIVTHDVPTRLKTFLDPDSNKLTHLNTFLEDVCTTVKFKKWYFGKYHGNKIIPPCYHLLFTDIVKFE